MKRIPLEDRVKDTNPYVFAERITEIRKDLRLTLLNMADALNSLEASDWLYLRPGDYFLEGPWSVDNVKHMEYANGVQPGYLYTYELFAACLNVSSAYLMGKAEKALPVRRREAVMATRSKYK